MLEAAGLFAAGPASCNPYVVIAAGKDRFKTQIIQGSQTPIWDEIFTMYAPFFRPLLCFPFSSSSPAPPPPTCLSLLPSFRTISVSFSLACASWSPSPQVFMRDWPFTFLNNSRSRTIAIEYLFCIFYVLSSSSSSSPPPSFSAIDNLFNSILPWYFLGVIRFPISNTLFTPRITYCLLIENSIFLTFALSDILWFSLLPLYLFVFPWKGLENSMILESTLQSIVFVFALIIYLIWM